MGDAQSIMFYTFTMVTADLDMKKEENQILAAGKLLQIIADTKDSVRVDRYVRKLENVTGISYRNLEKALSKIKQERKAKRPRQEVITKVARSLVFNPREEYCLALLLQHPELKGNQEDPSPEYFANSENREIFITWLQTSDLSALKEKLDIAIHEHLDALVNWDLPPNHIEQKFADCKLSLKREYLTNVEAKRASSFAHEVETKGSGADLAKLKEEGIEPSIQLREVFTQKGQRKTELRR